MKPPLYQIEAPPTTIKKAKLDNIALVPASLLPFKAQYQPLANKLPMGSVLICETNTTRSVKNVLENVAQFFRTHGHQVITLPLPQTAKKGPTHRLIAENLRTSNLISQQATMVPCLNYANRHFSTLMKLDR